MKHRRVRHLWIALLAGLASCCCWPGGGRARAPLTPASPQSRAALAVLDAFRARTAVSREQLPTIIESAEVAADRLVAHPSSLLNVPYAPQKTFAEDILNRSGGLANALPSVERRAEITEHDVFLFSVRSWEKDGKEALGHIAEAQGRGWLVVLFASKAGAPQDLAVGYLIDNGAPTGREEEGPVNALANSLNGWLWCCEYVAALTRRGKCPGILQSALTEGADEHNSRLQTREGRHWLGECDQPVAAGALARAYLRRIDELLVTLAGERIQGQTQDAARIIAERLAAGANVAVSTCTHFLMFEVFWNNRTPWKPFFVVWRAKTAIPQNVQPGDLLVWFGFKGLSTPYEDYGRYIRETGASLITSFTPDENPANNAPQALAHIDQSWSEGDAEVAIPCPPGRMAPISGINQGLLYRMLDAAAAEKLEQAGVTDLEVPQVPAP